LQSLRKYFSYFKWVLVVFQIAGICDNITFRGDAAYKKRNKKRNKKRPPEGGQRGEEKNEGPKPLG